jgi:hypothetical protein
MGNTYYLVDQFIGSKGMASPILADSELTHLSSPCRDRRRSTISLVAIITSIAVDNELFVSVNGCHSIIRK